MKKIHPSAAALAALRTAHAPVVVAESGVLAATKKLAEAKEVLRARQAEADRLPGEVAAGRRASGDLEAALTMSRSAALIIPALEAAVPEAQARVDVAIVEALAVVAGSIRERRQKLARDLPSIVKKLDAVVAENQDLIAAADVLRDAMTGRGLLAAHDLGPALEWPACWRDAVLLAGAIQVRFPSPAELAALHHAPPRV